MPAPRVTSEAAAPRRVRRKVDLATLAAQCDRFVLGDGPRRAPDLLAGIAPDVAMDHYGVGGVVAELEAEVAALLNKPAALFLPTGTMAQQATLRVHVDRRVSRTIAFHPECHLVTHEENAFVRLHALNALAVGPRRQPLSVAELAQVTEPVGALVVELPQRDLGGTLPTPQELRAQVAWARERGAAVHLDGARLWEAAPYYARRAKWSLGDLAELFDTVYVSFYKGLGAIAGCCVAGDEDVIAELSVWRTRHGGRAYMMWPYAASALNAIRTRRGDMARYTRHAQAIATALSAAGRVEVLPEKVVTPMMHLRFADSASAIEQRVIDIARRDRVMTLIRPFEVEGPRSCRFEFQVGRATMEFTPAEAAHYLGALAPPVARR